MAIRFRSPPDSTKIVRHLEDAALVVVASPAYFKRAGLPRKLADLERHECILFYRPSSGRSTSWLFNEDGHEKEIFPVGNYTCAEDVLACVTLAKAGAGLLQIFRYVVERDLAEGTLVEVLQPFGGRSLPVSLMYPHSRLLPSRVRAFVDFVMEQSESLKAAKGAVRARKTGRTVPMTARRG